MAGPQGSQADMRKQEGAGPFPWGVRSRVTPGDKRPTAPSTERPMWPHSRPSLLLLMHLHSNDLLAQPRPGAVNTEPPGVRKSAVPSEF